MSKKSSPVSYSNFLYEMGQDFLDIFTPEVHLIQIIYTLPINLRSFRASQNYMFLQQQKYVVCTLCQRCLGPFYRVKCKMIQHFLDRQYDFRIRIRSTASTTSTGITPSTIRKALLVFNPSESIFFYLRAILFVISKIA